MSITPADLDHSTGPDEATLVRRQLERAVAELANARALIEQLRAQALELDRARAIPVDRLEQLDVDHLERILVLAKAVEVDRELYRLEQAIGQLDRLEQLVARLDSAGPRLDRLEHVIDLLDRAEVLGWRA